jgi:hypothetical protein
MRPLASPMRRLDLALRTFCRCSHRDLHIQAMAGSQARKLYPLPEGFLSENTLERDDQHIKMG